MGQHQICANTKRRDMKKKRRWRKGFQKILLAGYRFYLTWAWGIYRWNDQPPLCRLENCNDYGWPPRFVVTFSVLYMFWTNHPPDCILQIQRHFYEHWTD